MANGNRRLSHIILSAGVGVAGGFLLAKFLRKNAKAKLCRITSLVNPTEILIALTADNIGKVEGPIWAHIEDLTSAGQPEQEIIARQMVADPPCPNNIGQFITFFSFPASRSFNVFRITVGHFEDNKQVADQAYDYSATQGTVNL